MDNTYDSIFNNNFRDLVAMPSAVEDDCKYALPQHLMSISQKQIKQKYNSKVKVIIIQLQRNFFYDTSLKKKIILLLK